MKKSILIPVIALAVSMVFMAGCESLEKVKEEKNKAIARIALEEVWSQGKLYMIDDIYDVDFIKRIHGSPDIHGRQGLKQSAYRFHIAFPDVQFTIEDQIAEGDMVVNRWTGSGTHKGQLIGIPPTGVHKTWTGITIYRFAGGKIVEIWVNSDFFGLLQQLGVILPISGWASSNSYSLSFY